LLRRFQADKFNLFLQYFSHSNYNTHQKKITLLFFSLPSLPIHSTWYKSKNIFTNSNFPPHCPKPLLRGKYKSLHWTGVGGYVLRLEVFRWETWDWFSSGGVRPLTRRTSPFYLLRAQLLLYVCASNLGQGRRETVCVRFFFTTHLHTTAHTGE
jgi:hypothetical protein